MAVLESRISVSCHALVTLVKDPSVLSQVSTIEAVIYTVNLSIELLSLILCAFLLAAGISLSKDSPAERTFSVIALFMVLNVGGDLISWFFTTGDGLHNYILCQLGNNLTYYCAPIAYTLMMLFAYRNATASAPYEKGSFSRPQTRAGRALLGCILALFLIDIAMVLANYATGWFYHIGAGNAFTWGPLRTVPDNIALAQFLLLLPLMLLEAPDRSNAWRGWIMLACIPLAGLAVENLFPTLMLVYPCVTLSLVMTHISLSRHNRMLLMQRELELAQSQTKLLSTQMRSHFIFNSLAAIEGLCEEDPHAAQRAIGDFSRYLRGNMQAVGDADLVPFSTEMQNVKSYLALEQIDPSSRFQVDYDLTCTSFRIPSLTVQPLVENAVRHGVARMGAEGCISIRSYECESTYEVSVTDNGGAARCDKTDKSEHNGIAIENVKKRLDLQCKGTLTLDITPDGAVATVHVPKEAVQ